MTLGIIAAGIAVFTGIGAGIGIRGLIADGVQGRLQA